MKDRSRTEYSMLNISVSSAVRIITIVLGYITRMVFTRMLSQHYLGVSGLFLDFFNLLSLSELGIGIAITYALYKPIAQGDKEKQKSVMDLYRRFYNRVALFILANIDYRFFVDRFAIVMFLASAFLLAITLLFGST